MQRLSKFHLNKMQTLSNFHQFLNPNLDGDGCTEIHTYKYYVCLSLTQFNICVLSLHAIVYIYVCVSI